MNRQLLVGIAYGLIGFAAVGAGSAAFHSIFDALRDKEIEPSPRAYYVANIVCTQFGGVKRVLPAKEGNYNVVCKDGTQVTGPMSERLLGHTKAKEI